VGSLPTFLLAASPRNRIMEPKSSGLIRVFARVEGAVVGLRKVPWFYLPQDLKSACLYLAGFDAAFGGAPLVGLQAWLILKGEGCRYGFDWTQNLQRAARRIVGRSASRTKVLEAGCKVLERFFAYRRRNGVRRIHEEYANVCLSQTRHGRTSRARPVRRLRVRNSRK
jgi:hypothetical protein